MFRLFGREISAQTMDSLVQFAKFCLVGIFNTFISLLCYYVIVLFNNALYIIAHIIGFIAGVLNSFFWNSRFVFKKFNEKGKTLIKTILSYGFSLILGTILLYLMVDIIKLSAFIAPIINIVITTPINYIINKKWAYKK